MGTLDEMRARFAADRGDGERPTAPAGRRLWIYAGRNGWVLASGPEVADNVDLLLTAVGQRFDVLYARALDLNALDVFGPGGLVEVARHPEIAERVEIRRFGVGLLRDTGRPRSACPVVFELGAEEPERWIAEIARSVLAPLGAYVVEVRALDQEGGGAR